MGSSRPPPSSAPRSAFTLVEVVVGLACLLVILLVILLPAIGVARRLARSGSDRWNVVGLIKAEQIYAGSNKGYFTSYDGRGYQMVNTPILAAPNVWGAAAIPSDGHGACASWSSYQVAALLNDGGVGPWILLSGSETNPQVTRIAENGNVDVTCSAAGGCCSNAMLSAFGASQVDSTGSFSGLNTSGVSLVAEWRDSARPDTILFSDRVLTQGGGSVLTSDRGISSVMTKAGSGAWKGVVGYGDAHSEVRTAMKAKKLRYGIHSGDSQPAAAAGVFHSADTTSASSYTGSVTGKMFDTGMLWSAVRQ